MIHGMIKQIRIELKNSLIVPIIPLNDHSCLVLDKLGNINEKID